VSLALTDYIPQEEGLSKLKKRVSGLGFILSLFLVHDLLHVVRVGDR
jgi:hypothetical protein